MCFIDRATRPLEEGDPAVARDRDLGRDIAVVDERERHPEGEDVVVTKIEVLEAVGGVDVYVKEALQSEFSPPAEGDPWATVDVQPGMNHLSGTEALAYARARKGSSDYARMSRQKILLIGTLGGTWKRPNKMRTE